MKVVPYRPEFREDFVQLNTQWLTRFYWVEPFDQYAIHLYKKIGFHQVPYRKDFWKSEKADIEMEREVF